MLASCRYVLSRILTYLPRIHRMVRKISISRNKIHQLQLLIDEHSFTVLNPFLGAEDAGACVVAKDVIMDYLNVYRTARLCIEKIPSRSKDVALLLEPLALLPVPKCHDDYLRAVGAKTRNMIRRSKKEGFIHREFIWNEHLDEIYAINTSKSQRCFGPMHGWYTKPVAPRFHPQNELPFRKYFGIFRGGRLYAYLYLVITGDSAFFKHFIGHADYSSYGIMNGLISGTVQKFIGHPTVRWLKYGSLPLNRTGSVFSFRRHAGFASYATFINISGQPDLVAYASNVQSTWCAGGISCQKYFSF